MIAVIGGTGVEQLNFAKIKTHRIDTIYDTKPVVVDEYHIGNRSIYFLSRHKSDHSVVPHLINYRANIKALSQLECRLIITFNAVGSIYEEYSVGSWLIPNQIIDYTWGREHSFTSVDHCYHIDFSNPFDRDINNQLLSNIQALELNVYDKLVYACTQGPRLETRAEIQRLKNDGCDIVGMTIMPEAALARECNIRYSSLCFAINLAAGVSDVEVSERQARKRATQMYSEAEKIIARVIENISF